MTLETSQDAGVCAGEDADELYHECCDKTDAGGDRQKWLRGFFLILEVEQFNPADIALDKILDPIPFLAHLASFKVNQFFYRQDVIKIIDIRTCIKHLERDTVDKIIVGFIRYIGKRFFESRDHVPEKDWKVFINL